jgi:hypothetical protein
MFTVRNVLEHDISLQDFNIKSFIRYPAVGLRYRIPPRHISQLKAWAILLFKPQMGKNFAVRWQMFME